MVVNDTYLDCSILKKLMRQDSFFIRYYTLFSVHGKYLVQPGNFQASNTQNHYAYKVSKQVTIIRKPAW